MNELTQRGIAALKSGDRSSARQLLTAAVKQNPNDALAWLWLTGAFDTDEERLACLRQVLRIDPGNQAAARGMAQILERRTRSTTSQPVPEQPQPDRPEAPTASSEESQLASAPIPGPPPVVQPEMEPSPVDLPAPEAEETPVSYSGAEAVTMEEPATAAEEATPSQQEEPVMVGETELAIPADPATVETPTPQPVHRRTARPAADTPARPIFRARPSLVPALLCFWLFLFGSIAIGGLLSSAPDVSLLLAGGLGLILELVVVYAIIRNLAVRYELTSQVLTLRFNGKRARVPVTDIYNAELSQTFWQRVIGIGHIDIDAAINGQLAHVRMYNIPNARMRTEQIQYLVKDHAPA